MNQEYAKSVVDQLGNMPPLQLIRLISKKESLGCNIQVVVNNKDGWTGISLVSNGKAIYQYLCESKDEETFIPQCEIAADYNNRLFAIKTKGGVK